MLLSSDFHEEFAYNRKHDQWQRKGQDGNDSSIKDYQKGDDTRWHLIRGSTSGRKFKSRLEGRRGWFTIFHVEVMKKVTSILRLGKKDYFFVLQDLETTKIMQMS